MCKEQGEVTEVEDPELDDDGLLNPAPINEREKVRQRTLEQLQKQHSDLKELRAENNHMRMYIDDMEREMKSLHGQIDSLKAALKTFL